jgi:hypothetical protein
MVVGWVEPALTTTKKAFSSLFIIVSYLFSAQRLEELEEIDCWKKVYNINYIIWN